MYGYRDHCFRSMPAALQFYCPYSLNQFQYPYLMYRQKVEEYPAHFQKRPQTPPPSYIPNQANAITPSTGIAQPSDLTPCVLKYTYLWLKNGDSYWAYIASVGRRALSGWRYKGGRWRQFGLNLRQLKSFYCS